MDKTEQERNFDVNLIAGKMDTVIGNISGIVDSMFGKDKDTDNTASCLYQNINRLNVHLNELRASTKPPATVVWRNTTPKEFDVSGIE